MTVPSVEIVAGKPEPTREEQVNNSKGQNNQDEEDQKDMTAAETGGNHPDEHRDNPDTPNRDTPAK